MDDYFFDLMVSMTRMKEPQTAPENEAVTPRRISSLWVEIKPHKAINPTSTRK
jgi:hypothetical protein